MLHLDLMILEVFSNLCFYDSYVAGKTMLTFYDKKRKAFSHL